MLTPGFGRRIVPAFYNVYHELGHGFLEGAYRNAMQLALEGDGLYCEREVPVDVRFRGHVVGTYRMDLVVEGVIVVECKTASAIGPGHQAQLLNYLRATAMRLGYLLNFGPAPSFKRLIHDISQDRGSQRVVKCGPQHALDRNCRPQHAQNNAG